jgi:hypothetical protein
VSFLLSSGPGILLLTICACTLVIGATMAGTTIAMAAILWTVRALVRLRRP